MIEGVILILIFLSERAHTLSDQRRVIITLKIKRLTLK
jgi:hypothetical protein